MSSSKIKRSDSIKQKSKGGRKDAILKENDKAKKRKTLTATAIKKAKGKLVKVEKKLLAKAKAVVKKVASKVLVTKKVVKKVAAKKAVAKKVVAKKVAPKKAVKKVVKKAAKKATSKASVTKQAAKKVVAKKVISKKPIKLARTLGGKVASKKVMKPTNGKVKKTTLKAKPTSVIAKKKIAIEKSPMMIIGEDLHFIPEHDVITIPVTQTEARKLESIFHHKEETAFHQENQKMRNALPSRKTMKGFNQNRGRK